MPKIPQSQSLSPMPVFKLLAGYIAAAASGSRDSLLHLVLAIFSSARTALAHLAKHYQAFPRALTLDNLARLKYCSTRLEAILYTLRHAPERFLAPSQLRALTRARAALARIWSQPVDFSPLLPLLTSPGAGPSPAAPASAPENPPSIPHSAFRIPHSSPSPLLLCSPGCALAAVLIHLGRIYGVPAPSTTPPASSSIPHSAFRIPHSSTNPQSTIRNYLRASAPTPANPPLATYHSPLAPLHHLPPAGGNTRRVQSQNEQNSLIKDIHVNKMEGTPSDSFFGLNLCIINHERIPDPFCPFYTYSVE